MDQYASKVLISGGVVPMHLYKEHEKIREKVINLYKIFFFGEELTEFEKEIEFRYMALKQAKFFKY